jgi:hypothetical protein
LAVFQLAEVGRAAQPAPRWFVDWVRLGIVAASWPATPRRVIAVSAPTESMATAAVTFGFTRASFVAGRDDEVLGDAEIDDLKPEESIWFRAGDTVRTGRFLGVDERGIFRTSNGHFQRSKVDEVRLIPDWLPGLGDGRAALSAGVEAAFLVQLMRAPDPVAFATAWAPGVAIVGSVSRVQAELAVRIGADLPGGAILRELAQVVRPLDRQDPLGCRSVLLSSRAEDLPWRDWAKPPRLTILRGPYATSRWLPETVGTVVSILGRSEAGIDSGVAALMQDRAYSDPLAAEQLGWSPPSGCEVLAYEAP